ncbi:MAG: hypothetical protein K2Y05_09145 [Hyphomicrobiaceae bacterium]|nr:hypothetical protein [Hyphomicrobiaceae bacterium]
MLSNHIGGRWKLTNGNDKDTDRRLEKPDCQGTKIAIFADEYPILLNRFGKNGLIVEARTFESNPSHVMSRRL